MNIERRSIARIAATLAASIVLGVSSTSCGQHGTTSTAPASSAASASSDAASPQATSAPSAHSRPRSSARHSTAVLFRSPEFEQRRRVTGARSFEVDSVEFPNTPNETTWTFRASTSFDILAESSRVPFDWVIVGRGTSGDLVIERWLYTPPPGSIVVERPVANTPVGTPYPTSTSQTVGPLGGTYIPLDQRERAQPERRSRLATGIPGDDVRCLCVDPDGRYALYYEADDRKIYRLGLAASPSPVAIFDSTSVPELAAHDANSMTLARHLSFGRVCIVGLRASTESLFLVDSDNDGDFEAHLVLTRVEMDELRAAGEIVHRFHFE